MLAVQTILHPTDFSDRSKFAFYFACALARDYGARLIVVHVAPAPTIAYGQGVVPPNPEEFRQTAENQLRALAAPPKVAMEHRLIEGDAGAEILRTASEIKADLIVMGTHGRTGLGRLLMGSVAEHVSRHATCPVLTVKSPFAR